MSVLIVGAGIAGILSGYHLKFLSSDIEFKILEARSKEGGRIQNVEAYDFNLDLGPQDLFFADKPQLERLFAVGDDGFNDFEKKSFFTNTRPVDREDGTLSYRFCEKFSQDCEENPDEFYRRSGVVENASFQDESLASFINTFFLPTVKKSVNLTTAVTKIDYKNPTKVVATDRNGNTYEADQLIVAVPVSQLKEGANNPITFDPPLPPRYRASIEATAASVEQGARIFVEFSTKFYDDVTKVSDVVYWDAARFKSNTKNIVTIQGNRCTDPNGGTCTNNNGLPKSEKKILKKLLRDLDNVYGDKVATKSFEENGEKYYFQNWSTEPYIEMSNRGDVFDVEIFKEPIKGRIWFAGEYTRPRGGNLAGESGKEVANWIFDNFCGELCMDDTTWRKFNIDDDRVSSKDCEWVDSNIAEKRRKRCKQPGSVFAHGQFWDVKASEACPKACGECADFC